MNEQLAISSEYYAIHVQPTPADNSRSLKYSAGRASESVFLGMSCWLKKMTVKARTRCTEWEQTGKISIARI